MTDSDDLAPLALAEHYLEIGQPQAGLAALDRSGGTALETSRYWELRARAFVDLGRHRDALDAARTGLRASADDTALLSLAARAAAELGDLPDAERLVLAALRNDSEDPDLLAQYALLLVRAGQTRKAHAVLARAERVDPLDATVVRTRAILSFLAGRDREARRHGRRLLEEVDPADPVAHAVLGATAADRGAAGLASRHLDETARYDVRDHAVAGVAREARIDAHWLLWPMRPIARFGPGVLWMVGLGGALLFDTIGLGPLGLIWLAAYVLLALYSWTIAPLARRYLERRLG